MQLTIIRGKESVKAETATGTRLIEALERAGVSVSAPCGGRCFCGKCLVRVKGDAGEVLDAERKFISADMLKDGWRLACACAVGENLTVYVDNKRATVLVDGMEGDTTLDPEWFAREIICEKPSLTNQVSDAGRIAKALNISEGDISDSALLMASDALRADENVWASMFGGKVSGVYSARPAAYGCAVDIGTTTMAAYLVDLSTGVQLGTASMLNPQRAHGGDVITRANYTMENPEGLSELAGLVRRGIAEMISDMCASAKVSPMDVRHITLVGNTIMMHLAANLCVRYIATLPFVPVYAAARHAAAGDMHLPFANAFITLGPCVAGYVGADTMAAAVACGLDMPGGAALMLDIGTNGEIALRTEKGVWCCSAAAGPAFEGAHIKCGSGAVDGAIDSVRVTENGCEVTTIGGAPAASICGSGIISAVAELLRAEIIDETGRMEDDYELAPGVVVCQKDVREVQLAKAAIAAGIGVLLDEAGIDISEVEVLYLAGGFGNFIDRKSACEIGLIPMELLNRIKPVGNAAGAGAKMMALNKDAIRRADELRARMKYVELSASADFQERFADNMLFE